jgi:hypothetical protein
MEFYSGCIVAKIVARIVTKIVATKRSHSDRI